MVYVDTPVLVLGGGPVGLATALELDHHGIAVLLVEPRTVVDHSRPRAKTTSVRTMEHFRRWGVADRVRAAAPLSAEWSSRVTFVQTVTGREIVHLDGCLGLAVAPEVSPEPAQQITQPLVEEVLRAALAERPGVTTRYGWRGVEVNDLGDYVRVSIEDDDGRRETVTAAWVVGADGPRSVVRGAMGAHYEGAPGGRPNVNVMFRSAALGAMVPHPPSIHFWVLNPAGPGVVGPADHDGTWWAISTGTPHVEDDAHAARIVRELVGADIDVEILATDPWQARLLLADRYRAGRLFIVGDAAHQNPPWGGHGFNTGVGDAVNLGWKLAAVISGWAPDELLDSYGDERRPIEQQTIDLAAGNMAALSIDLSDPALMADGEEFAHARDELAPGIARAKASEFYADGLVLGYGYGDAAAAQAPTPAEYRPVLGAGNRLPHRIVDGRSLYDLLGREFTVIGPAAETALIAAAAARRGIPIIEVIADGPVVLVRPDQHVVWTAETVADADAVFDVALAGFRTVPA